MQKQDRPLERTFAEPVYTTGTAAGKIGVSTHTLRLYEKEGLIIPYKTNTGRRLFSDLEVEKIRCIRKMIEEGLNFEGIRRLVALVPCYKLRGCNVKKCSHCGAFANRTRPCWAASEKCLDPLPSCRECTVYQSIVSCDDVQKFIYSFD